jgi:hypothetical protein
VCVLCYDENLGYFPAQRGQQNLPCDSPPILGKGKLEYNGSVPVFPDYIGTVGELTPF